MDGMEGMGRARNGDGKHIPSRAQRGGHRECPWESRESRNPVPAQWASPGSVRDLLPAWLCSPTGTSSSSLGGWGKPRQPAREAVGCKRLLGEIVAVGRVVAFPDGADGVRRLSLSGEGAGKATEGSIPALLGAAPFPHVCDCRLQPLGFDLGSVETCQGFGPALLRRSWLSAGAARSLEGAEGGLQGDFFCLLLLLIAARGCSGGAGGDTREHGGPGP